MDAQKLKSLLTFLTFTGICYWMISYDEKEEDTTNLLKGGKGDGLSPKDVDSKEFALGVKTEMEHTSDKRIAKEIALDHLAEDSKYYSKLAKIHKENPRTAIKADEKLWDKVKKEAVKKMGGHSARAMQYAVKLYKDRGGKYIGKKDSKNDLATWTKAKWQYAPKSKTKDRYLPLKAWEELSASEEKATRSRKKGKLGKWVKNTKKASRAAKRATKKARNAK